MNHERHYLSPLFEPKSVAIIGASETPSSIGVNLVRNMLDSNYPGKLYFVNPRHQSVFGHPCYAAIGDIPQRLDLAVICTQARLVPGIVEACGVAGTRSAIIISGGFSETGPEGAALERAALDAARRHKLRLLGPNTLGIMRPGSGINLSFANGSANPGSIGLISQSGALCAAIVDWALPNNVGFSSVISLGTSSDVDFGETLDYLVADPRTENIFLYIEGIRNARRFMSALRAAARCKPVLLIKVGRHPAGEQAVLSHTGAVVGADDVFDAALRRAGVVRLASVGQMYAAAQALFSHFHPRGNRLAIITNGGGPGVMAADYAADIGVPLAALDPATSKKLNENLPPTWSNANPLDIVGDADPSRYAVALEACLDDRNVDGVLVILTPQAMTDPTQVARIVIELAKKSDKPLVTCWMGEEQVREARLLFKGAGVPFFRTPEPAVQLFAHISNYYRNQKLLMQTPASLSDHVTPRLDSARLVIETALSGERRVLSEMESKALLAAFHIPIARTMVARSLTEAVNLAREISLPVVMKIDSLQIAHKSDSGGVRLNLATLSAVQEAYQEILEEVHKNHPDALINGISIEPMIVKPNGRELMVGMMQDVHHARTGRHQRRTGTRPRRCVAPPERCADRRHDPDDAAYRPPRQFAQDAGGEHGSDRSGLAARLRDGLRTAVDPRTGNQSADRRRARRRRRRLPHPDHRPAAQHGSLRAHGDPSLSIGHDAELQNRGRSKRDDPPDQAGRCPARTELRQGSVGGEQVFPLHEHHPRTGPVATDPPHPDRLRPRNGLRRHDHGI